MSTEGLRQRGKGKIASSPSQDENPSKPDDVPVKKPEDKPKATDLPSRDNIEERDRQRHVLRSPQVKGVVWVKFGVALSILLYIHFAIEEMPFFSLSGIVQEVIGAHYQTFSLVQNLLPRGCALVILLPMLMGLLLSFLFALVMLEDSRWKFRPAMLSMLPVYLGGTWVLMMCVTWTVAMMPLNSWATVWALPAMSMDEVAIAPRRTPRHSHGVPTASRRASRHRRGAHHGTVTARVTAPSRRASRRHGVPPAPPPAPGASRRGAALARRGSCDKSSPPAHPAD